MQLPVIKMGNGHSRKPLIRAVFRYVCSKMVLKTAIYGLSISFATDGRDAC